MGMASNWARSKWVASNLKQVKVAVKPGTASAFKHACETAGVSMASVLSQYMAEYSAYGMKHKPASAAEDASTKMKRRQLINRATHLVWLARNGEERAKDNTPGNLQCTSRYASSGESIAKMEGIIDQLCGVYSYP